jgi:rod shape-determining protein MreC
MLRRPHYIIVGVVLLLTVVLLKLPSRTATQIKLAISGLFLPLYGASGSAQQLNQKAGNAIVPRSELLRQLDELQKENQLLKIQAAQWEEVARENSRLRQSLGFPKQVPWKLKPARVVARDPANWWRTLKIDAGTRDGLTLNAPALSAEGCLVGRISEVGYAQSQVVLVGDPACRVAVLIEDDKTRENGVIAPSSSSPLDNTLVDLSFLSRTSQLKAGQRVTTSGLGGIFPKGIRVGQIVDFRAIDFGLYNEARVKLEVKMNTLEEVWVILP